MSNSVLLISLKNPNRIFEDCFSTVVDIFNVSTVLKKLINAKHDINRKTMFQRNALHFLKKVNVNIAEQWMSNSCNLKSINTYDNNPAIIITQKNLFLIDKYDDIFKSAMS